MADDATTTSNVPRSYWVVFWCGIGGLAIAAGLFVMTLMLRNSNFWTLTSEEAPWIVTSSGAFVSSAAIVLAALGGAWLGGRSALKTQEALLAQQREQADADRKAAEARDEQKRARVVADARSERLRTTYAEHIAEVSAIKLLLAKLQTELVTAGESKAASEYLLEIMHRQVALQAITSRLQLVVSPALIGDVVEFEYNLGQQVTLVSMQQVKDFDLKPLSIMQFGLTMKVWRLLKDLDEGKDFEMVLDPKPAAMSPEAP